MRALLVTFPSDGGRFSFNHATFHVCHVSRWIVLLTGIRKLVCTKRVHQPIFKLPGWGSSPTIFSADLFSVCDSYRAFARRLREMSCKIS